MWAGTEVKLTIRFKTDMEPNTCKDFCYERENTMFGLFKQSIRILLPFFRLLRPKMPDFGAAFVKDCIKSCDVSCIFVAMKLRKTITIAKKRNLFRGE